MTRGDPLGWPAFRELLARFTATPFGRDRALDLTSTALLPVIRSVLAETAEARRALGAEGPPPFPAPDDIRPLLADAAPVGATLDGPSLVRLGRTLEAVGRLHAYGTRVTAVAPGLATGLHALPRLESLAQDLRTQLDPDGHLRDEASPRLRSLRRDLVRLRADLQLRLERLLDSPAWAPALQERYVTVRNGRYVVPVRDDARRVIRGIIHDRSQSGATVFVEPEEAVPLNNDLVQRQLEERAEVERLLALLTDRVRTELRALHGLVEGLGSLDLAFARAGLAERLDATEPQVEMGGDLDLPAARHPLLVAQGWGRAGAPGSTLTPPTVVPVDLHVSAAKPGLVISGPNAGGKTVALETCGLLVLMAQVGCHLPTASGSRVPVCDEVLAVIGDEQSLAQNLSTFSSFVAQMREILDRAGPRTLVLLDELGAGTDPAEGAALGQALLEALLDRGARVVVTTHLEPLKVFAQTEARLANATVAFDTERLAPTFQLQYGYSGPSYALTIAARFGLPPAVVARARTHLTDASRRLDALLADLARREREATRIRREAHAEARALLADARRRAGQELDRLQAETASRRDAQDAYHRLRAAEAEVATAPGAAEADAAESVGLADGVTVRGLGLRGRIVAEEGDTVTVQAGQLTVRVARDQLDAAPAGSAPSRSPIPVSIPQRDDVPREFYLIGLTADEARAAVEKYLDDAVLAGHATIRLVHGKGTGALKRAVDACLKAHPLVRSFHTADAVDGGAGATVAVLHEGAARPERAAPRQRAHPPWVPYRS